MPKYKPETLIKEFWNKVAITADDNRCWLWLGNKNIDGYGLVKINCKQQRSHRVAWAFPDYVIPDGMIICHSCDNPSCCNPKHLFLGTQQDNMGDKVAKGRQHKGDKPAMKGELHPQHKLTSEQVIDIRERYLKGDVTQRKLAEEYGLSHTSIGYITNKRNWKHI